MNILVLTDVLPAPVLSGKQRENDVLLTTAGFHEQLEPGVHYTFVFVSSYSNLLLSFVSRKWKELYGFNKLEKYEMRGRTITIVPVPNFQEDGPFKALFIKMGYYMNRRKLRQLVERQQIELVHAHDIKLNAGLAYHLFKDYEIPYVVTSRKLGKLKLSETLVRYLQHARAVINLGFSQQAIAEQYHKKSTIIPHGVDERFLKQEKIYPHAQTRQVYPGQVANNQLPEPFRIVTLSRLLKWKNIDQVLMALAQLEGNFVYDIYGEGPDEERLKNILSTLKIKDKVHFKGHLPYQQVPDTLQRYDLFVLPSYREMFGRVYVEAMACGLPVIGAKKCGIDGYIENGRQGFLVDHENVEEIAASIGMLMDDPERILQMGKAAKLFSSNFSWTQIIRKIDAIYRESIKLSKERLTH